MPIVHNDLHNLADFESLSMRRHAVFFLLVPLLFTLSACEGPAGIPGEPGEPGDSVTGPAGEPGAKGADGLSMLNRIIAEPAGAHCEHGGLRIDNGFDLNRNGVLDEDEIEAGTTEYVCSSTASVYSGSFIVQNADDLAKLNEWETVNGQVMILYDAPTHAELVIKTKAITGVLSISSVGSTISVSAPNLEHVSTVDLTDDRTTALSFPKLERVFEARLEDATRLRTLEMPNLRQVLTLALERTDVRTFTLPQLRYADSVTIKNNPNLTLISMGGDASFRRSKFEASGNAKLTSLTVDGLAHVERLWISSNPLLPRIDLPELHTVEELRVTTNAALTALLAPNLSTWDSISVTGNVNLSACDFVHMAQRSFRDNITVSGNKPGSCPSIEPATLRVSDKDGSLAFVVYSIPKSFEAAEETCSQAGGHLASFLNAADFLRFSAAMADNPKVGGDYWIGYRYDEATAAWRWQGSYPSTWHPAAGQDSFFWKLGEPRQKTCIKLSGYGEFLASSSPCASAMRYVCSQSVR